MNAAEWGFSDVAAALVKAGADPRRRDAQGRTAFDLYLLYLRTHPETRIDTHERASMMSSLRGPGDRK
jgi:hypothetical protein